MSTAKAKKVYKVFVSNIPYSSGYQEVHDAFTEFGPIKNCVLPSKRGSKGRREPSGTAFVTFYDEQSLINSLSGDSKLTLGDRELGIQIALNKSNIKTNNCLDDTIPQLAALQTKHIPIQRPTENQHCLSIPTCVWHSILSLLDIHALCRLEQTSRLFHSICRQHWYLMTSLSFRNVFYLRRFKSTSGLSNELLALFLSRTSPSLRSLDVSASARFLTPGALQVISHYSPQLSTLDISGVQLSLEPVQNYFLSCCSLRNISLAGCSGLSEKVLWWIIKSRRDLISLNISECMRVTGNCFRMLNGSLLHLNACGCLHLSDQAVSYLCAASPALLSLNLELCYSLSPLILKHVSSCANLRSFQFPRGLITQDTIAPLPQLLELSRIHTLQHLDLSHQQQLSDSFLYTLVSAPLLTTLKIPGCYLVSDVGISHLRHCPHLSTLDISYLNLLSDTGLLKLQLDLRSFTARLCPGITHIALCSIIENSTSLLYLDVSSSARISSNCFPSLAAHLKRNKSRLSHPLHWAFGGTIVTEEEVHQFFEETGVRLTLQDSSNYSFTYGQETEIHMASPDEEYPAVLELPERIEVTECLPVPQLDLPEPQLDIPAAHHIPPRSEVIISCEENWDDDCEPPYFFDKSNDLSYNDYSFLSDHSDEDLDAALVNYLVSDDVIYSQDNFELS